MENGWQLHIPTARSAIIAQRRVTTVLFGDRQSGINGINSWQTISGGPRSRCVNYTFATKAVQAQLHRLYPPRFFETRFPLCSHLFSRRKKGHLTLCII